MALSPLNAPKTAAILTSGSIFRLFIRFLPWRDFLFLSSQNVSLPRGAVCGHKTMNFFKRYNTLSKPELKALVRENRRGEDLYGD
jgi:hypothetical protein